MLLFYYLYLDAPSLVLRLSYAPQNAGANKTFLNPNNIRIRNRGLE
jgi:hypothetical protein